MRNLSLPFSISQFKKEEKKERKKERRRWLKLVPFSSGEGKGKTGHEEQAADQQGGPSTEVEEPE